MFTLFGECTWKRERSKIVHLILYQEERVSDFRDATEAATTVNKIIKNLMFLTAICV